MVPITKTLPKPYDSSEGLTPAFPGPWTGNILSPSSRTQYPVRIFRTTGNVESPDAVLEVKSSFIRNFPSLINGYTNGCRPDEHSFSSITFDFGKEVCGPISISSGPQTTKGLTVALSYSESSRWVGFRSDESSSLRTSVVDGHFEFQIGPEETFTVPLDHQRGGYRYATIFTKTPDATLELTEFSAYFTAMPHWKSLQAYPSYFHCNDELLNRLWYAAAYTNQLSTLAKDQGRRCELDSGWLNNAICCTSGETVITDAPRRDRTVWAGDLGIVIWTQFLTLHDTISMRNAIDTLFHVQRADGHFPWAGPPICHDSVSDIAKSKQWPYVSDTYHIWTMIVARHYFHLTGDMGWLKGKWEAITLGMKLAVSKFNSKEGLYFSTGRLDWGRVPTSGFSLSPNILFYQALTLLSPLATLLNYPENATIWLSLADTIHVSLEKFWDPLAGLYVDNLLNPELHPQDGNSLAVLFRLASPERSAKILKTLKARWGSYGPINPEIGGAVSPFISGFEMLALLQSERASDALEMMRSAWGWMINHPLGTGTMMEAWSGAGEFKYQFYADKPSYISFCHPWSGAPALGLVGGVLGLGFEEGIEENSEQGMAGRKWVFMPQLGDLKTCEGGFTGKWGLYSAGWEKVENGQEVKFRCWVDTPLGTAGKIRLPRFRGNLDDCVKVDGEVVQYAIENGLAWVDNVEGGCRHHIQLEEIMSGDEVGT